MSHYELKELKQADQLRKKGEDSEALKIISDLEKWGDLSSQNLLSCMALKAKLILGSRHYSEANKYTYQVLDKTQKQADSFSYLEILLIQAYSFIMMGELNQGIIILKQVEELFENFKGISKIDLRETESLILRTKGLSKGFAGDIPSCIKLNKKALELAKDSDDLDLIVSPLLNLAEDYQALGDYDKAIYFAKSAREIKVSISILGVLIEIFLSQGDIENAKYYFQEMSELREKDLYPYYEALILKTSLRARDRIKAEDLFKQIIKENKIFEFVVKSLINICDLLLIELRMTNDPNVIKEINPYITMLLNIVEQSQTYWFAVETYLLQGKFHLLTFDLKKAKRFLTQAKQIAERSGRTQLVTKITKENDDLLKDEDLWKKLKEEDAPMADRVALARLHEQIEGMFRNPTLTPVFVRDEKIAITKETKICLVCRSGALKFTYICECGAIYCESCARALTNLENVCWSCEAPIDTSKPTKLYMEKESIIAPKDAKK